MSVCNVDQEQLKVVTFEPYEDRHGEFACSKGHRYLLCLVQEGTKGHETCPRIAIRIGSEYGKPAILPTTTDFPDLPVDVACPICGSYDRNSVYANGETPATHKPTKRICAVCSGQSDLGEPLGDGVVRYFEDGGSM